jgi:hypothetical protein
LRLLVRFVLIPSILNGGSGGNSRRRSVAEVWNELFRGGTAALDTCSSVGGGISLITNSWKKGSPATGSFFGFQIADFDLSQVFWFLLSVAFSFS